jgi:hypothetical protein
MNKRSCDRSHTGEITQTSEERTETEEERRTMMESRITKERRGRCLGEVAAKAGLGGL